MRTRYGVVGDDVIAVDPVNGRRHVITWRSHAQSISVGMFGPWLVITERWHAVGESETDVWLRDGRTLERLWWARVNDGVLLGRDGHGCIVVARTSLGKSRWEAWRIGSWERVDGYELPDGAQLLPGLAAELTPFDELPRLCDASPLGRWIFEGQHAGKHWTGAVEADSGSIAISETRGGHTFTRRVVDACCLEGNRAKWHGEYGGNLVHVTILALNQEVAQLSWDDGITHGWEIALTR